MRAVASRFSKFAYHRATYDLALKDVQTLHRLSYLEVRVFGDIYHLFKSVADNASSFAKDKPESIAKDIEFILQSVLSQLNSSTLESTAPVPRKPTMVEAVLEYRVFLRLATEGI